MDSPDMPEEEEKTDTEQLEEATGAFIDSLKRNNKQIRNDRAGTIVDDAELAYKHKVDDIRVAIMKLSSERDNMMDLSPDNAQSLILADNFNSEEFVEKDIELGVKIESLNITFEIATERYNYLFGKG